MTTASEQRHARIIADALYDLDEIEASLGLGVFAIRQARKRGLKVRKIGRKHFVIGRDLIQYAEESAEIVR